MAVSKFSNWLKAQPVVNQKLIRKKLFDVGISKSTFYRIIRTGDANESTKNLIELTLNIPKSELF